MYDNESINRKVAAADAADRASLLDSKIVRALEHAPEVQIPEGFAARVASQAPAKPAISIRSTYYGRIAIAISLVALLAALLALAGTRTNLSPLGLTLQWMLLAQFIGLVVWLSIRRYKAL